MADVALDPVDQVIKEFKKLPGIGRKSAQRIVFSLLRRSEDECLSLAKSISDLKKRLVFCSLCNNAGGGDPCRICADPTRNSKQICVVEEPFDILSIEKSSQYHGLYHVLHGTISPIDGIGPEDLKIRNLFQRLSPGDGAEVIIATNPTIKGEATALYLSKLIKSLDIKVTRIASGLPVGSDLEYADEVTISRALLGRHPI